MSNEPQPVKREPRYRKPCPNLPKGQRCPLCGSTYICVQWQRKKAGATP